jgi:hypothetical protein
MATYPWWLGNTVDNIGTAAGSFPPGPVLNTLGTLGTSRGDPLAPYIGALGPPSVTGPARGAPAGPPIQAREAPNLALTRERFQRALEDDPRLAYALARNRSAEIGPNATPAEQAFYNALVIDRAAARGEPLGYTLTNPDYFPGTTLNYRGEVSRAGVDPALWAGANPANFATGNASLDPVTGRWVGFAGGPQTATIRSGRGMELAGIEKRDLPYARAVGYTGPESTPIGPAGPIGMDMAQLSPTGGGWETTVSAEPGGVPYSARAAPRAAASVALAESPRAPESSFLGRLLSALGEGAYRPAAVRATAPFAFSAPVFQFRPTLGARSGQR